MQSAVNMTTIAYKKQQMMECCSQMKIHNLATVKFPIKINSLFDNVVDIYAPININPQRGGDSQGELDNLEKLLTNFQTTGKNFVSEIPLMGHQSC